MVLAGNPYTNNHNQDHVKITYERAQIWGYLFQSPSTIYFDVHTNLSGEEHKKYAIKAAFNTKIVTDELTASFQGLQYLIADAKFYGERLHQYDIVPKHYRLWHTEMEGWAGVMIFM